MGIPAAISVSTNGRGAHFTEPAFQNLPEYHLKNTLVFFPLLNYLQKTFKTIPRSGTDFWVENQKLQGPAHSSSYLCAYDDDYYYYFTCVSGNLLGVQVWGMSLEKLGSECSPNPKNRKVLLLKDLHKTKY